VCPASAVERYGHRLSGPLRDRFDLAVEMAAVPWREINTTQSAEATREVRTRVCAARSLQAARQGRLNARLEGYDLQRYCRPADKKGEELLASGVARLGLSVRAVTRVLRVARTIADLEGSDSVAGRHVAEALHFRLPGRMG
jgi:magnesium chelatase family protein